MNDRQDANQAKLDRLMAEAQRRYAARQTPGATRPSRWGTSMQERWNGSVWVTEAR